MGTHLDKETDMTTDRLFETPDLYLSAALVILLKIEPTFKVVRAKTLFCFQATDDLYRAMSRYNAGVPVCAIEYSGTIRRLRAEMLVRRNTII